MMYRFLQQVSEFVTLDSITVVKESIGMFLSESNKKDKAKSDLNGLDLIWPNFTSSQ